MPPRKKSTSVSSSPKNSSSSESIVGHPCTYIALLKWSCKLFQKLGWMMLAKQRGHSATKILAYKESLLHIEVCLEDKIKTIKNVDRKEDLEITLGNIRILIASANAIL